MSVTTRDIRTPLPGHVVVNIALAAGVWGIGVALTAQSIPPILGLGPYVSWLAAASLQALLSAAQSNIRVVGLRARCLGPASFGSSRSPAVAHHRTATIWLRRSDILDTGDGKTPLQAWRFNDGNHINHTAHAPRQLPL
jgi:hypothetical protein